MRVKSLALSGFRSFENLGRIELDAILETGCLVTWIRQRLC